MTRIAVSTILVFIVCLGLAQGQAPGGYRPQMPRGYKPPVPPTYPKPPVPPTYPKPAAAPTYPKPGAAPTYPKPTKPAQTKAPAPPWGPPPTNNIRGYPNMGNMMSNMGNRMGNMGNMGNAMGNMGALGAMAMMKECKPGWIPIPTRGNLQEVKCYLFNYYQQCSFIEAEMWCEKLDGAHLVTIKDPLMNNLMAARIKGKFWIGLNDVEYEGHHKWLRSGNTALYTNLLAGTRFKHEPSKNCAAMDGKGIWVMEPCKSHLNFICEK